jgi:LmbE family N-acetylglucosaminyl deacetylase
MRLSFAGERILAVMAHPDDTELLCAGTLARAKADGAEIGICVMCNGNKGLSSMATQSPQALAAARRQETQQAADLLGAALHLYDWPDGELLDGVEQRCRLVEIYRRFRPTLVISHGHEDYHPDHRAAGTLAEAASWFCASRGHWTESGAMLSPPALWIADTVNMSGFQPEFYIDIGDFVRLKQDMLNCHKSQLVRGKDGDFTPLTEMMLRQVAARGAQAGSPAAEAFRQHHAFKRLRSW